MNKIVENDGFSSLIIKFVIRKIIFQTQASCPIDRRPFQAVCRLDALDKQIKVCSRLIFLNNSHCRNIQVMLQPSIHTI